MSDYEKGDIVRIKDTIHYDLPCGGEVIVPENAAVELSAFHKGVAWDGESCELVDQVEFYYNGHEVRVDAGRIMRPSS